MSKTKLSDIELDEQGDEIKKPRFDLIVHHRNPRTGKLIKHTPYIKRVVGEVGSSERATYWERPAGSGNLFNSHNNPIGRWEYEEKTVKGKQIKTGKFVEGAAHIAWEAPLTQDQKVSKENAALKAELAAMKAEQNKAQTAKKQDKGA